MKVEDLIKLGERFINASKEQFVYHIKSTNFKGKVLYSLEDLKSTLPDVYKVEVKKYKDREDHPKVKIPILDATWDECVKSCQRKYDQI